MLNSGNRKMYEMFKEGERLYHRFEQETGAQDPEMEKEIDRIITDKMQKGMGDADIIDEILGGAGSGGVRSNADIDRLEDAKIRELMAEFERKGQKPISMDNTVLFGNEEEAESFEAFQ
jgi:hypothetical protein